MLARRLDPRVVGTFVDLGWTVMYGPQLISFHYDHRSILRFDDGRVEVEDRTDPLWAPSLADPVWAAALAVLGLDLELLSFNPASLGWTQPLRMAC